MSELYNWLLAIQASIKIVGEELAMREYVSGLHQRKLMYHFDDCAIDCLVETNATGVTRVEAELINVLTKEFHAFDSDMLFDMAMELFNE